MRALRGTAPGLSFLFLSLALAGCKNECQQMCVDMAKYAKKECGLEFPKDQLKTCLQDYGGRNTTTAQRDYCSTVRPALQEEWACEDLEAYFDESGAGAGDSG